MRLDGKVAIITGAARGRGAANARLFVPEGPKVVLADLWDDEGEDHPPALGPAGVYQPLDDSPTAEWATAVDKPPETSGGVDVLVNNAAIHHVVPIEQE